MKTTVNITDFRNNISSYINHVIYNGDDILLKKGNKIVAKVIYYNEVVQKHSPLLKLSGLWKNEDLTEFEKSRNTIKKVSKKDVQLKNTSL